MGTLSVLGTKLSTRWEDDDDDNHDFEDFDEDDEDDPKSCFKIVQVRICTS